MSARRCLEDKCRNPVCLLQNISWIYWTCYVPSIAVLSLNFQLVTIPILNTLVIFSFFQFFFQNCLGQEPSLWAWTSNAIAIGGTRCAWLANKPSNASHVVAKKLLQNVRQLQQLTDVNMPFVSHLSLSLTAKDGHPLVLVFWWWEGGAPETSSSFTHISTAKLKLRIEPWKKKVRFSLYSLVSTLPFPLVHIPWH